MKADEEKRSFNSDLYMDEAFSISLTVDSLYHYPPPQSQPSAPSIAP